MKKREKTISEKLIEAFEKAGIKGERIEFIQTPEDIKRHEEVEAFLREREEERKRTEEYLREHPIYFKGFSTAAML